MFTITKEAVTFIETPIKVASRKLKFRMLMPYSLTKSTNSLLGQPQKVDIAIQFRMVAAFMAIIMPNHLGDE